MAKKSVYDKIALGEILSDAECRTINDNGRLHPPSHEVYRKFSNLMADKGSVITPKHVHTIINNNRAGFRDTIMRVFGIRERERSTSVNDANYSVEKCTDQSTVTLTSLTSVKLSLVISQEKWKSIKPQKKLYEGYCRECHAKICCTLLKEPSKGVDVILQCSIDGIRPESHSGKKRRQLRGARRLKVADNFIDGL
ncbi:unnamed protein product [Colias eurytheme]|nr:unnamed protein product [Colias eurytheme]